MHNIRWAIRLPQPDDPGAVGAFLPSVVHAYLAERAAAPDTTVTALCSTDDKPVTFTIPGSTDLSPADYLANRCAQCRRIAWSIVNPNDEYPSAY